MNIGRIARGAFFAAATALGAALITAAPQSALAQQQVERAGAQRNWSVFETGEGASRLCWIVSSPKNWVALRNGRRVSVNRGDIYLMVSVRPADGVRNEVNTVIGYTFRDGATVKVEIGSDTFAMFTEGENAWFENAAADDRAVAAMKAGVEAKLTGVSSRGTTTVDTYSLIGFTAALEEAQSLCR